MYNFMSLFANYTSQFLLDRLGRYLKLFVSYLKLFVSIAFLSSRELAYHFGLAIC